MLYKNYGFKKSKTKQYLKPSITQIKSSIKLDSFLNFSKISNDSISSINNTEIKIDQIVSKEKPKNKIINGNLLMVQSCISLNFEKLKFIFQNS